MNDEQKPASQSPQQPPYYEYYQPQSEVQKHDYSPASYHSQPPQFQQPSYPPQQARQLPTGWSPYPPAPSGVPTNSHQPHQSLTKLILYVGITILIMGILGSVTIAYTLLRQGKTVSHQASQVSQPLFPPIGTPIQIFNSPTGATSTFASTSYLGWSPDGSQLYGVRQNGDVQIWDTTTWNNILTYEIPDSVLSAGSFSPDRQYFATWNVMDPTPGTVRVWNTITGNEVLAYQGQDTAISATAWSPDGTQIASDDGDLVQIWNATTGNTNLTLHTGSATDIAWSPDGTRIVVAADTSIQIWDVATGNILLTFHSFSGGVQRLVWSPNGRYIAVSGIIDPNVQIWDAMSGSLLLTYKGHTITVLAITWSPDSQRIATGSADNTVQIWDPATGTNIFTYHGQSKGAGYVAWSPDGRFIASSGGDGTVQIWWAV